MPSVFEQLILSPEIISNKISISNSFTAESVSARTAVVSSANGCHENSDPLKFKLFSILIT